MLVRGYDVAKGESNSIDHPLCGKVTQTTLHLRKNRLNDKMLIQVIGNVDKYGCDYQSRDKTQVPLVPICFYCLPFSTVLVEFLVDNCDRNSQNTETPKKKWTIA